MNNTDQNADAEGLGQTESMSHNHGVNSRGPAPLTLSIRRAVDILESVGAVRTWSPLASLAETMRSTVKSSQFIRHVRSLRTFGLIDAGTKDFKLTELGLRILKPQSEEERRASTLEAFLSCDQLQRVYDAVKGGDINEKFFANTVENILGVSSQKAKEWADLFIECAIDINLIVRTSQHQYSFTSQSSIPIRASASSTTEESQTQSPTNREEPISGPERSRAMHGGLSLTLPLSNGGTFEIRIPPTIVTSDLPSLELFLEHSKAMVRGFAEANKAKTESQPFTGNDEVGSY